VSLSLYFSPRRVAVCIWHREPAGYRIRLGERAGDSNSLDILTGSAFPMNDNLPAPTIESGVNSSRAGNWGRTVERTISLVAPARPLFLSLCEGHRRLICKFLGGVKALRSLLLPFVHDANQSANGLVNRLFFAPVLSSACLHAHNKAWSSQHDAQRNSASRASGASSYE